MLAQPGSSGEAGCPHAMKKSNLDSKKNLQRGYTTGACAQAAARGAALTVVTGYVPCEAVAKGKPLGDLEKLGSVEVTLPNGEASTFLVKMHAEGVCSVIKDAGDDPDITNGVRIIVSVAPRADGRVTIDGAEGVGRVTLEGLAVKPGEAAVNPVPYKYIHDEVKVIIPSGADVTISIPEGEELAKNTFNPRLGIIGGLSILGTTGRVEPWSNAAYQESLLPKLDIAQAAGVQTPVLVPGSKGEKAAIKEGFEEVAVVHVGNFFGMMLEAVKERGYKSVSLMGHASKLAKMARGNFDTHSRHSDMPLDVLAESAIVLGLDEQEASALKKLPTTEAAIRRLLADGKEKVLDEAARRVAASVEEKYSLRADVYLTDGSGDTVGRCCG